MSPQQHLLNYVQAQLSDNVNRLSVKLANISDSDAPPPKRYLYRVLKQNIEHFLLKQKPSERWIIVPGLRGVGKTTLLIQIFLWLKNDKGVQDVIYISLDEIIASHNLKAVLSAYERLLGQKFYQLGRPVFILIDEIQVDSNWPQTIKQIYDWNDNVFIICSGSSATGLQINADIAGRRAQVKKLLPLDFKEYQSIYHQRRPNYQLSDKIRTALYDAGDASTAYQQLKKLQPLVNKQWTIYQKSQLDHYFDIGTMPFSIHKDVTTAYEALRNNIFQIIATDTKLHHNFSPESLYSFERLIQILADGGDVISTKKLVDTLQISRGQLFNILDALVKAEFLIKIPACGTNLTVNKQPVKYSFMSPAMRVAQRSIRVTKAMQLTSRGLILEDIAALHYYKEFACQGRGLLTYPYDKRGEMADFILRLTAGKQIALEFGLGHKNISQLTKTMRKFKCHYGLLFSQTPLKLVDKYCVTVPLDYFYLV